MSQNVEVCNRCGSENIVVVTTTTYVAKKGEPCYKEDVFLDSVRCFDCENIMQDSFDDIEAEIVWGVIEGAE